MKNVGKIFGIPMSSSGGVLSGIVHCMVIMSHLFKYLLALAQIIISNSGNGNDELPFLYFM